jgi:hypothetical protein
MCGIEGAMLQRGMNYRFKNGPSVILMSRRRGAPYRDEVLDDGKVLIYEGHDVPKSVGIRDPKKLDQLPRAGAGKLTENGKFLNAAESFKSGTREAELVRVYEKIKDGIWVFNGIFRLVDAWQTKDRFRHVYKFKLTVAETDTRGHFIDPAELAHNRLIPSSVKLEVYRRDKGQCVLCGSKDNLHFDHDLPYSRGGTSLKAENIRLLCARNNLSKSNKIE